MGDGVSSRCGITYNQWINNPGGYTVGKQIPSHCDFLNNYIRFPVHENNITVNVGCCAEGGSWSSMLWGGLANFGMRAMSWLGLKLLIGGLGNKKPKVDMNFSLNPRQAYWNAYWNTLNAKTTPVAAQQTTVTNKKETTPDKVNNPENVDDKKTKKDEPVNSVNDSKDTGKLKAYATATNGDNEPIKGGSEIKDDTRVFNNNGEEDANGQFPEKFTITDISSGNTHVYTFTFIRTDGDNVIYQSTLTKIIIKDDSTANAAAGKPVKYAIPKSEFTKGKFTNDSIASGNMEALAGQGTNVHKKEFAAKDQGKEVQFKVNDDEYTIDAEA